MLLTDEEMAACVEPTPLDGGVINPHLAAKAQLKKVVEWGNENCTEHAVEARESIRRGLRMIGRPPVYPRHDCYTCWQSLLKEVEDA